MLKSKNIAVLFFALHLLSSHLWADFLTSFGSGENRFSITFVQIGNTGNVRDSNLATDAGASLNYSFNLGKHEVSRDAFQKANIAGGLGLNVFDMTSYGGNGPNKPITGVSWNQAARFVNWLNTSQGHSVAYKFATQPGDSDYDPLEGISIWVNTDSGYNPANLFRNSQAKYFLPSVDEWHKAAYYDANKGQVGGYWTFPTSSDSPPTPVVGGIEDNTAVYKSYDPSQGPAEVTNSGAVNANGLMGMGGNVFEWMESPWYNPQLFHYAHRAIRGGDWIYEESEMSRTTFNHAPPDSPHFNVGFRVASVPEPGGLGFLISGFLFCLVSRRYERD